MKELISHEKDNDSLKSESLKDPVLVGREHELEMLQQSLDLAIKGKGTTVFYLR